MKSWFLLTFILFVSALQSQIFTQPSVQPWAPLGAKWWYSHHDGLGYQRFVTLESINDTFLHGFMAKQLRYTNAYNFTTDYFIRQDSSIIYLLNSDSSYCLLYNMSLPVGSIYTLECKDSSSPYNFDVSIDTIDSISINNHTLIKLYQHYDELFMSFEGHVIDKIGHIGYEGHGGFFFPLIENSPTHGIRCYFDSIIGYYHFPTMPDCEQIGYTGMEEPDNSYPKVYPNPFKDYLEVYNHHGGISLDLYDIGCSRVYHIILNENFEVINDLQNLIPGYYLFEIKYMDGTSYKGKIVKLRD